MASNYKNLQTNERVLRSAADNLSQPELAALGLHALDYLSKTLTSQEFAEFIQESVNQVEQNLGTAQPASPESRQPGGGTPPSQPAS